MYTALDILCLNRYANRFAARYSWLLHKLVEQLWSVLQIVPVRQPAAGVDSTCD